ncbi:MAG: tetratricopeptide repeat protein, partial [Verrucomicrobiae bacterium]|nr:tetratricopeptide repeat protein [Verrucomicrobiae bacterium]
MARCLLLKACVLLLLGLGLAGCKPRPADPAGPDSSPAPELSDQFLSLLNTGRNQLEQGEATNALVIYRQAAALVPHNADVHLNLANAHLLAGDAEAAIHEAEEVLRLDPNSAAAWFVKGSAQLRLAQPEEAVKSLANVQTIDPGETATFFQLGKARMELRQWDEAINAFREGIARDPNHLHTTAHYLLGQALLRAGRKDEASAELQQHQAGLESEAGTPATSTFEKSKYTR